MEDNVARGPQGASPGVLLLGLQGLVFLALINPYTAAQMYPDVRTLSLAVRCVLVALYLAGLCGAFYSVCRWRAVAQSRVGQWTFTKLPALGGIFLSGIALLLVLAIVEIICWRLVAGNPKAVAPGFRDEFTPNLMLEDPVLGWRGRMDKVGNHKCFVTPTGELLFDKNYTYGPDRYRVIPAPEGPKNAHFALFGCSYTFGVGSNDDETYPAYLAAHRPDVRVYSFALPSYGPAQALMLIREGVLDRVSEADGAGAFLLIPDHLNRLHPKMSYLGWMQNFPAFDLDEKGVPRYLGSMSSVYRWRQWGMFLLGKSQFKRWAKIELPTKIPDEAIPLCAALLAEAREEYRAKFPSNEFYIVLDPLWQTTRDRHAMIEALEKHGLPLLNARGVLGDNPGALHYPHDFHPMPEANRRIAEWVWEQLQVNDSSFATPAVEELRGPG